MYECDSIVNLICGIVYTITACICSSLCLYLFSLLLKELFDVTSESGGDNEMKTFDMASRSFGRKNILNHLSLIDRYFAEFQKKLSSNERPASLL